MNIKNILMTVLFILCFTINTFSVSSNYTNNYNIINNDELFEITGTLPIVNTKSTSLNKKLNEEINKTYETNIQSARKNNVAKLDFSYEVIDDEKYVSIILYTQATNLGITTYTDTFVFDKDTNKVIELNNFSHIIPNNKIDNNEVVAESNSLTINKAQSNFYIQDDEIVLIDSITKGDDVNYVKFSLDEVTSYEIEKNDYYMGTYKIVMVPLRETLENLGYSVIYKSYEQPIEISKGNKIYYISLNKNMYSNGTTNTSLEVLPEVINNTTFIPISFFSDILNIHYDISNDSTIRFNDI